MNYRNVLLACTALALMGSTVSLAAEKKTEDVAVYTCQLSLDGKAVNNAKDKGKLDINGASAISKPTEEYFRHRFMTLVTRNAKGDTDSAPISFDYLSYVHFLSRVDETLTALPKQASTDDQVSAATSTAQGTSAVKIVNVNNTGDGDVIAVTEIYTDVVKPGHKMTIQITKINQDATSISGNIDFDVTTLQSVEKKTIPADESGRTVYIESPITTHLEATIPFSVANGQKAEIAVEPNKNDVSIYATVGLLGCLPMNDNH